MKPLIFYCLLALTSAGILSTQADSDQQNREALIAEARSMGYIAEYAGRVAAKFDQCGFVRFDFSEFLSDTIFRHYAILSFTQRGFTAEDSQADVDQLSKEHVKKVKSLFEAMFKYENTFDFVPYGAKHHVKIPSRHPIFFNITTHDSQYDSDPKIRSVYRFFAGEKSRASGEYLLTDLRFAAKELAEGRLYRMGNEEFYQDIAKKILGVAYENSVIRKYGSHRSRRLEKVNLWKIAETDIWAKVCFPTTQTDDDEEGVEAFRIVPKGVITENDGSPAYTYSRLHTTLYAQDEKGQGLADLMEVRDVLFDEDGLFIVENFHYQSPGCSLINPTRCLKRTDLIHPGSAREFKLAHKSIVVTDEKYAECVDEKGTLQRFELKHPIFVHDSNVCLLKVGKTYLGEYYLPFTPINDADIVEYLNDVTDPITWYNSPKTRFWRLLGYY